MFFISIKAVLDALNDRDGQNRQVSGAKLEELLQSFQSNILANVNDRLEKIAMAWDSIGRQIRL